MTILTKAEANRITLSHIDHAARVLTIDAETLVLALLKAMNNDR